MDPDRERWYRWVFLAAAIYDITLGLVFTFVHAWAFDLLDISDEVPPDAYVTLLGVFVLVLGIAYALIYRGDLRRNRDLILVGTIYKLAYATVAIAFWAMGDVPHTVFGIFGLVDLIFLILMFQIWRSLGTAEPATA